MDKELLGIWKHMLDLGLAALAHANRHAVYYSMENSRWSELSVLQAAHAAELLIKARIAQEHPLLIFEKLPHSRHATESILGLPELFQRGITFRWSDLPERLWATTGISIPNLSDYERFGYLRNGLQHFSPSPIHDPAEETLKFVFNVIDPFIHRCWDLYAVDYDEDCDPYVYFVPALIRREILFNVSQCAAERFEEWTVEWDNVSDSYRRNIEKRVEMALSKGKQAMTVCDLEHRNWPFFESLPHDQGGHGRHKCAGCAYELGYQNGLKRCEQPILDLDSLPESQAGVVRHKSPHAAFAMGYSDGVHASYKK